MTWIHVLTGWGFAFLPGTIVATAVAVLDGKPPMDHPVVLTWALSAGVLGILGAFIGGWTVGPGGGSVRLATSFVAMPSGALAILVSSTMLVIDGPAGALGIGAAVFLPAPLAAATTAWLVTRA